MSEVRKPSLVDALIPVVSLIVMLIGSVYLFSDNSSYGANQIALILAALIAVIIGIKNGMQWIDMEEGFAKGISMALGAILILLSVGALIGTWILAGIVPTMIYYGLQLLDPNWFYAAACIICALIALSIGSSWTTAGTVGVGLIGTAAGLGVSLEITAGAVVSGAYFGDKMSPLSDTTNLAPAVTGTDLFSHIRHMMWTTVPSLIVAIIFFAILGATEEIDLASSTLQRTLNDLEASFTISWVLLIPLVVVLFLAIRKFPAFPTIIIGALLGGVFAVFFQFQHVIAFADANNLPVALQALKGVWTALFDGFSVATGNEQLDELLNRGGMSSMLNTVWLIICAMSFGGILEKTGLLQRLVDSILGMVRSTGGLISATIFTGIGVNVVSADQYIAIILPGRMYRMEFARRKLHPKNLSRALEDSSTITSPLIPWNTCGAFMAGTLGVATLAYLPFAFFNWITPIVSLFYGLYGIKIEPLKDND
ncbi:MAG: Na+/H+ antiporter NhaC [Pseudomonadota bacterium]